MDRYPSLCSVADCPRYYQFGKARAASLCYDEEVSEASEKLSDADS